MQLNKLFFIIILILIFFYIKKNYKFLMCKNCINQQIIGEKCARCEPDELFCSIKFKSREETLNELIYNKKSITRFGDGEFKIIFGINTGFQKFNYTLREKLLQVLNSNYSDLLVGIMQIYKNRHPYWIWWFKKYKLKLAKIINTNKTYYDAGITRFYNPVINRTNIYKYIKKFKIIWNNRNILIIEGDKTRVGFGNDLLNNSKSIKRVICPAVNAFNSYYKIIQYIKNLNIDKETLILISLGPTATILSYDIFKLGYQVIDFGHFDLQYEYYLRKLKTTIRIPNKYTNEVYGGNLNITPIKDPKYLSEITVIHKIY